MKQLNFPAFILLLVLNSTFLFGANGKEWQSYSYSGTKIVFPADWSLDTSRSMGIAFFLFSPLESTEDHFRENVNLIIQDLQGQAVDLDTYCSVSTEQIKSLITNSSVLESTRKNNGHEDYQKIVYTGDQGVFHLKFIQYYFVLRGKAYVLTFTTQISTFEKYRATGEQILDSFSPDR